MVHLALLRWCFINAKSIIWGTVVEDLSIFEGGSLSKSKIWRKLLMLSGSTLDTYQWQNLHSPAKNELFFCLPWSKIHHAEDFLAGNAALGESLTFNHKETKVSIRQYCHFADGFCLVALLACFSQEVWLILYQLLWPFVVASLHMVFFAIVAIFYSFFQLGYISHHLLSS